MEVTLRSSPWRLRKYLTRPDFSICIQATPRASEEEDAEASSEAGVASAEPERTFFFYFAYESQGNFTCLTRQQKNGIFTKKNITIFAPKSEMVLLDLPENVTIFAPKSEMALLDDVAEV